MEAGQAWPRAQAGFPEDAQVGGCSGWGMWGGGQSPSSQARDQSWWNWWLIRQGANKYLKRLRGQGRDDDVPTPDRGAVGSHGQEGADFSTELGSECAGLGTEQNWLQRKTARA